MFKSMKIKTKTILVVSFGLLLLTTVLASIAINKSREALLNSEFDKLSSIVVAKNGEIENYFDTLSGLLSSMANDSMVKNSIVDFDKGFSKLKREINVDANVVQSRLVQHYQTKYLNKVNYEVPRAESKKGISTYIPSNTNAKLAQYIFIVDNQSKIGEKNNLTYNKKYKSSYMSAHKKYHPVFNKFLTSYALYDIFLVNLKGDVVYTDFKEKDFATNLNTGAYKNTGLAKAYKKALQKDDGEVVFEDFAPYEPSYNVPASFIATPIYVNGIKKGILVFQIPIEKINNIMQFNGAYKDAGLGDSGECYLVGPDYYMRSNSRFQKDIKDKVVHSLGTTVGVWKVDTKSSREIFKNANEKIGALFRAMHTIKGTAGMFEFTNVVSFAHTAENLLSEVRDEKVELTENMIETFFKVKDHVQTLVDLAVEGEELEGSVETTNKQLLDILKSMLSSSPQQDIKVTTTSVEETEQNSDEKLWHISFRLKPNFFSSGMDVINILNFFTMLGDVEKQLFIGDKVPLLDELNSTQSYIGYEMLFKTDSSYDDIEDIFEFVRDDVELNIFEATDTKALQTLLDSDNSLKQHLIDAKFSNVLALSEKPQPTTPAKKIEKKQHKKDEKKSFSLRVESTKIDQLINQISEMVIANAKVTQRADILDDNELSESAIILSDMLEEVRTGIMNIRMVQVGDSFNKFKSSLSLSNIRQISSL